jgi:hypothetical protein
MKAAKSKMESPKKGVVVGNKAPSTVYAGGDSNVVKEAKERKRGGACNYKKGGDVEGKMAMKRLDRPGRAKRADGGKVGANERPLSTAAHTSNRPGGDVQEA